MYMYYSAYQALLLTHTSKLECLGTRLRVEQINQTTKKLDFIAKSHQCYCNLLSTSMTHGGSQYNTDTD